MATIKRVIAQKFGEEWVLPLDGGSFWDDRAPIVEFQQRLGSDNGYPTSSWRQLERQKAYLGVVTVGRDEQPEYRATLTYRDALALAKAFAKHGVEARVNRC